MSLGGRNLPGRPPNIIKGTVGWMLFILNDRHSTTEIWTRSLQTKTPIVDSMTDKTDLSKIIASKGDNPLILSPENLHSEEDIELERKLRELKFKQELRKDWILFIVRDVVIFPAAILFIFAVSGYSLFLHIYR